MRNSLLILIGLFLIPLISSCGTIYGAAVDERNLGTIASDHEIKSKILKAFANDEQVGVLDFSVSSYEGHVYLIGEYKTQAQKTRAVQIAKSRKGVSGITSFLLAENPNSSCDGTKNLELTAKVKAKLVGDKGIWSTNIDVKTMQCVTVLWGLVGSQTEIGKAVAHARSVKGVARVKSFLKSKSGS